MTELINEDEQGRKTYAISKQPEMPISLRARDNRRAIWADRCKLVHGRAGRLNVPEKAGGRPLKKLRRFKSVG
jgi:hypothetical protein